MTQTQRIGLVVLMMALTNSIARGRFGSWDIEAWITLIGIIVGAVLFIMKPKEEK